jgi:hypothetical protein
MAKPDVSHGTQTRSRAGVGTPPRPRWRRAQRQVEHLRGGSIFVIDRPGESRSGYRTRLAAWSGFRPRRLTRETRPVRRPSRRASGRRTAARGSPERPSDPDPPHAAGGAR